MVAGLVIPGGGCSLIAGTCQEKPFARGKDAAARLSFEAEHWLLPDQALIRHNKPIRLLPSTRLVEVSMSANPPARLEDEFCISCERMFLLPIWGGVFEGDSFAVSVNGRSLLIFVVAHGDGVAVE